LESAIFGSPQTPQITLSQFLLASQALILGTPTHLSIYLSTPRHWHAHKIERQSDRRSEELNKRIKRKKKNVKNPTLSKIQKGLRFTTRPLEEL
jgi:hypothetical protein